MNWSQLKETIGKTAPILGTLLGGPSGTMVGSLVANALGVSNQPDAVEAALLNPDNRLKLRQWSMAHNEKLEQIALQTLQTELADKANARKHHNDSPMPSIITAALTALVGALLYTLFFVELPESNREVAYMLFGQASALWGASVTYWVGTTRSSADKSKMLKNV